MPVIRTIKNHLLENGSRISYIKHAGYKNIFPAPEGVLITGIHCTAHKRVFNPGISGLPNSEYRDHGIRNFQELVCKYLYKLL